MITEAENFDMTEMTRTQYTAFNGSRRIAAGDLTQVAAMVKDYFKGDLVVGVLIFEDTNGNLVDIDFRGTADDVLQRIARTAGAQEAATVSLEPATDAPTRGPGRPKLGVVAREVTLLPRHWDWLNTQTGGASVALRKLVEAACRASSDSDRIRLAQEASYRFMSAAVCNEANFEEVARALFGGSRSRFNELVEPWPVDLRDYLKKLAVGAFQDASAGDAK
jgi:uncharacterized protein